MFPKHTPKQKRTHSRGVVNSDEHLSKMSPSEIVDEMESIFFGDLDSDVDPDVIDEYLDYLNIISPIPKGVTDSEIDSFENFCENNSAFIDSISKPLNKKAGIGRICRIALIASIVCILMFTGTIVCAKSSNSSIAHWIQETFTFNQSDPKNYGSLQEALDAYSVNEKLVPTWLPDGFAIVDVGINEGKSFTTFSALYVDDNANEISIIIKQLSSSSGAVYEKSADVQKLTVHGTDFYVTANYDCTSIIWNTNQYECCISGDINKEDVYPIIDSIE